MAHDDQSRRAVPASRQGLKPGDAKLAPAAGPAPERSNSTADRRFEVWREKQLQAIYRIDTEPDST